MVDTPRTGYPSDMLRATQRSGSESVVECAARDIVERVEDYAREQPLAFGLWALGLGFVLGWRLKPW